MMTARFKEIDTGVEVQAMTVYQWGEDGTNIVLITYPDFEPGVPGMTYAIDRELFDLHFEMLPNQVINARAIGGTNQTRPTASQRAVEDRATLAWAKAIKQLFKKAGVE